LSTMVAHLEPPWLTRFMPSTGMSRSTVQRATATPPLELSPHLARAVTPPAPLVHALHVLAERSVLTVAPRQPAGVTLPRLALAVG
jgi:hypothetical protein